jgi:hypothetical protein
MSYQGIPEIDSIALGADGIFIDSITFATSKVRYLVTGNFLLNGEEEFYSIYLNKHPKDSTAELDAHFFDNEVLNDSLKNCTVEIIENKCEIVWTGYTSRIYLIDSINVRR